MLVPPHVARAPHCFRAGDAVRGDDNSIGFWSARVHSWEMHFGALRFLLPGGSFLYYSVGKSLCVPRLFAIPRLRVFWTDLV